MPNIPYVLKISFLASGYFSVLLKFGHNDESMFNKYI